MALNRDVNEKFRNAFEQKCFRLIIEAYEISLTEKRIQLDWNENDISHELYEKIDSSLQRLKWSIFVSREFYLTQNVNKVKGFADHLPRIDFRMSHIFAMQEYKYFCEAKRLKEKDKGLKRGYIKDGMDRFISKKYPLGCMLGYLLQGKIDETVKGINFLLAQDKRNTEILKSRNNNLLKDYYESNHLAIGTLKHLILDFTILSN